MKTIYKYELLNLGVNEIEIPVCSEYLKVDVQRGVICLWALVDTESRPTKVKLIVVGTGCDINSFSEENNDPNIEKSICIQNYIDTVQLGGGHFVFHIFNYRNY